jgi:hypothetical protein
MAIRPHDAHTSARTSPKITLGLVGGPGLLAVQVLITARMAWLKDKAHFRPTDAPDYLPEIAASRMMRPYASYSIRISAVNSSPHIVDG